MEAAQGEGRAVGGDEEVAPPEIRGQRRDEVELDRPLAEPGHGRAGRPLVSGSGRARDVAGEASRTAARTAGAWPAAAPWTREAAAAPRVFSTCRTKPGRRIRRFPARRP